MVQGKPHPVNSKEFNQKNLREIPDWCLHEGETNQINLDELLSKTPPRTIANAKAAIAEKRVECIHRALFHVYRSKNRARPRVVHLEDGEWRCRLDSRTRDNPCGHIIAVLLFLNPPDKIPSASRKNRGNYWHAERQATRNHELLFSRLICGILRHVPEPQFSGSGRPPHSLQSQLYQALQWV
jgi:hypothetical protein